MFRTWSGPGGSSHKGPLVSVLVFSGLFSLLSPEAHRLGIRASLTARRPLRSAHEPIRIALGFRH